MMIFDHKCSALNAHLITASIMLILNLHKYVILMEQFIIGRLAWGNFISFMMSGQKPNSYKYLYYKNFLLRNFMNSGIFSMKFLQYFWLKPVWHFLLWLKMRLKFREQVRFCTGKVGNDLCQAQNKLRLISLA